MQTAIVYFTGTGNNLYVAKQLQKRIDNTDIFPFHRLKDNQNLLHSYDRIIYCSPVYYSHIPPYVMEILNKTNYSSDKEIITIVVCAGNRGHAIEDMRACVQANGQKVVGEYMIMLPGNYILSYGAFPKRLQHIEFWLANRKINIIVHKVKKHKITPLRKTGIIYKEKEEPRLQTAITFFSQIGQQFVVSDECIGCGICVQVCPVNNIEIIDKKPQFSDSCQQCMACVQGCVRKCIDYDNKAINRKRYHHEKITVRDIIKENEH